MPKNDNLSCKGEFIRSMVKLSEIKLQPGEIITKCSKCGRRTIWDIGIIGSPLCKKCWDNESSKDYKEKVAAGQRAYRERNKEKVAAGHLLNF